MLDVRWSLVNWFIFFF